MAHFDFTRTGGVWTGAPAVTPAELADLDAKTEAAINGDGGGTWAPTTTITIGGQGVTITGTSILDDCQSLELTSGFINVYSGAQIQVLTGGVLEVQSGGDLDLLAGSTTTLSGAFDVTSTAVFTVKSAGAIIVEAGGAVDVAGDISIGNGGSITASSGASVGVASGASLSLASGSTFTNAATTTVSGKTTYSGTGGRRVSRVKSVTNASDTVGVDEADIVYWTTTTGANFSITLAASPTPDEGESIKVRRRELSAGDAHVIDASTGLSIYQFEDDPNTNGSGCMEATWIGGRWRVTAGVNDCFTSDS